LKTKTVVDAGPKYVVKSEYYGNKKSVVKAIYKAFNDWYWIITAYEGPGAKGPDPFIAYGYVAGDDVPCPEWGTSYMADVKSAAVPVPKSMWDSVKWVEKVAE